MTDLSIIIPIYNSHQFIVTTVRQLIDESLLRRLNVDIFLCDDGSRDQSLKELEKVTQEYDSVKIFNNEQNKGLGYTLRRLISLASSKKIVYCDVDLPFGTAGIFDVWDELEKADIVVASRYAGKKNYVSLCRQCCSRLYWLLCRVLFNIAVKDIGSGTVAFCKSKIEQLNLRSNGFDIHLELYVKAARQQLCVKEIGIPSVESNAKTFSLFKHTFPIVKNTFRLWLDLTF